MGQLSNKDKKARKEHQCDFCLGNIVKGEVYNHQVNVWDGSIGTWKSHLKCLELTVMLDMYGYDGVNEETFYEYVRENYGTFNNEEGDELPVISEMAIIVYDQLKREIMCEECNGHVSQSECPVCSEEGNVTPINELTNDDVLTVNPVNGRVEEVTVWRDGSEEVVDINMLAAQLQEDLRGEHEEE